MAAGQLGGQPIIILKEGSQRTAGREAQKSNIMAAKAVAGAVRTTLGPKGMDKMMVDNLGDVVITNDGVTILKEMDIEHPAAKMMVEIAKTQDAEVGDGTTTAVVLAGELLKQAEGLLDQEIHPTVIAAGYRAAADKAMEILNKIAVSVTVNVTAPGDGVLRRRLRPRFQIILLLIFYPLGDCSWTRFTTLRAIKKTWPNSAMRKCKPWPETWLKACLLLRQYSMARAKTKFAACSNSPTQTKWPPPKV